MNLSMGFAVELLVAVLLVITIGYCIMLNKKLNSLHGDREALKQMVADLVKASNMANSAIKGLKTSAIEADNILSARLSEADKFSVELANHISSANGVLEKITRITLEAKTSTGVITPQKPKIANEALRRLKEFQKNRENAA